MTTFDFQPRTRVVFGTGSIQRLGELAASLGGSRVLLVSDPGIVAAGHPQTAIRLLTAATIPGSETSKTRDPPRLAASSPRR